MIGLAKARGIACGLVLLLIGFGARSIAANATSLTAAANEAAATAVAQRWITAAATEQPIIIALAEPAPLVARPNPSLTRELPPAATLAWPGLARFFTINEVLATRNQAAAQSPSVQLAAIDPSGPVSDAPSTTTPRVPSEEPFGLFTFRAPQGPLWTKWHKVEADIQAEAPALARCRAEPDFCRPAEARFAAIVKDAEAHQGRVRLELVNRRINDAIRYTPDIAQWGVPDVWSAPLDTNNKGSFNTGRGDCEDYAIAKYVALRDSGVAARDLQLLLVRDKGAHLDHAVLAARDDDRWVILDNRWTQLIEDREAKLFTPLFAINDEGVKLFAAPYANMHPRQKNIENGPNKLLAAGTNVRDFALAESGGQPDGAALLLAE